MRQLNASDLLLAGMNSWVFSILCALNLLPGWASTWTSHHCSLLNAATPSGHPPAHQSWPAGVCDSSLPAIPPEQRATAMLSIVSASPGGCSSPSPTLREKWPRTGKTSQWAGNTPQWAGNLCRAPAHKQADWRELKLRKFVRVGSPAAVGLQGWDAQVPLNRIRVPLCHLAPLTASGRLALLRLGAKAEVRHTPPAGSFPSKQLGALIPLCERKPAAVLTARPRWG